MTKTERILLDAWETQTQNLAEYFANKYFGTDNEHYWVGGDGYIGGVFYVNERFFDMDNIVHYLKYGYSAEDMLRHYDYVLECNEKNESPINIKNWKKMK